MTVVRILHRPKRLPPKKREQPTITSTIVTARTPKREAIYQRWLALTGGQHNRKEPTDG